MIKKIYGEDIIDTRAIEQLERCVPNIGEIGVLTADAHVGYSCPIGGVTAYKDKVSLSAVGFDIACGNYAVRTDMKLDGSEVPMIMDQIFRDIPFGIGKRGIGRSDHPVLEKIRKADFYPQRELAKMATEQIGSVGSGNHFVDLFEDEEGFLWIGVHFGSRGFGYRTTQGFLALNAGKAFSEKVYEGAMDSPPILFDANSQIGQDYIQAVRLAGEYAFAGREAVVNKVLEILGNPKITFSVHNNHNFMWYEEHNGDKYWVMRKGATPAFPGQLGFIGANMRDSSVIVRGVDCSESREGLYSTVHGAGRILSRTQAAGKRRWKKGKLIQKTQGLVDLKKVHQELREKNVELRGAGADEAPECYKSLKDVLEYHKNTIEILYTLKPIGVAMAGENDHDPYAD